MSNTTGYTNSCDITTIFPMGVVCVTENASSASASDGSMSVFVTGGTAPYTIQWSNGMSGVFTLNNLPPGTYFATVTDYYGDYVETAACVVGGIPVTPTPTPTTTATNTPTPTPEVTPTQTVTITNTPSVGVSQTPPPSQTRTPAPTPSPSAASIPQTMCLELDQSPYTSLEFSYDGNYNGFPQWTATTDPSIVMSFDLINNFRWEISNYPTVGNTTIVNSSQVFIPLGSWEELGTSNTWTLSSGDCAAQPLNVSYVVTDESCLRSADGTLTVTINGGTAPYTLEINNLPPVTTSSTSYTFTGLNSGNNTLIVSDSASQSSTQNFTVGTGNNSTTYQITFTYNITNNGPQTQNSKNQTLNWTLNVSPQLPSGGSLTFDLLISRNYYQQTATLYGASQVATYAGTPQVSVSSSGTINSTSINTNYYSSPGSICDANGLFSGQTDTFSLNLTIDDNTTVNGYVQNSISVPAPLNASCPVFGQAQTTISIVSPSISGVPCSVMLQENQIINEDIIVGINQIS